MLFTAHVAVAESVLLNEPVLTLAWAQANDSPEFYNIYVSDNESAFSLVGKTRGNSYTIAVENQHTYRIKIQSADTSGGISPVSDSAGPFTVLLTKAALTTHDARTLPEQNVLLANYPNPFNPETWIPYQLSQSAEVAITIYNARGEHVRTLNVGHQSAGSYVTRAAAAYWDGRSELGEAVASGVYYYAIRTSSGFASTRKMVVMK